MSYSYPLKTPWSIKGAVVFLHFALLLLIATAKYEAQLISPPKSLVIQTVTLQPHVHEKKAISRKPIEEIPSVVPLQLPAAPEKEREEPVIPPLPQETREEVKKVETPKKIETPKIVKKISKKEPITKKKSPEPRIKKPLQKPQSKPTQPVSKKEPPQQKVKQETVKQEKIKQEKAKQEQERKEAKEAAKKRTEERRAEERAAQEKRASMVAEALSSLNKIEKHTPLSSSQAPAIPVGKIGTISAERAGSFSSSKKEIKEPSYYDELVQRLKLSLQLPEYGEVKIELILSKSGKVVRLKCLQSKSKKNANYLEKMIPSVSFPPFGHNFANEKEHTFQLRICEDIMVY